MASRWIGQAERNTGSGKAPYYPNQPAIAEVIGHFEQSEIGDAVSGPSGQVHRTHVVGEKSARRPKILGAIRRNKGPDVRIRSDVVHNAGVVCELGGKGRFAVPPEVACRGRANAP